MKTVDCDYFVVGTGMAGLMSALHLASYGKVVVVSKGRLKDCNTNFAQGGICCVMDEADTFDKHARDTMIAGAWLGNSKVVHTICENAPEAIGDLIDCGVVIQALEISKTLVLTPHKPFDVANNKYDKKAFKDELQRGNDYLEYTKEILARGRRLSAEQGKFIGSKAPFGYKFLIFIQST